MRTKHQRRLSPDAALTVVLVGMALAAGCAPNASPSAPAAAAGLEWRAATEVERPLDAFPSEMPLPTGPSGPGTAGHPGHFPGQSTMADVIATDGGLVAVGFVGWEWRPVAWRSADGDRWTLVEIGRVEPDDPAFAVAVTTAPDGRIVAVGRSGPHPTVWTSANGAVWTSTEAPTVDAEGAWSRMTTIASSPSGTLVGGSVGPELGERAARFWRSMDGATWTAVPAEPAFVDGEVAAILPVEDGWLALGRLGTGQRSTGSVAWRSPDGERWTRIDDPDLARGLVRAVTRAPDGSIVAVGSETDEIGAYVWRSTDEGATWTLEPEEPSRTHFGRKIRMTDVIATGDGLLAVGNYVELQYGTGQSWLSTDAIHWQASPRQAVMGQVEPSAVVAIDERYVMVGTFGAPDNYIPRAWLSPPD